MEPETAGKKVCIFQISPVCPGKKTPWPSDAISPVPLLVESPQTQGCPPETPAVTNGPHGLATRGSSLRSSTLQLKTGPASQRTQAKNLGVIPDFSSYQIPHTILGQIIWVLLSRTCLLFTTSPAITLSQPPSPLVHITANGLIAALGLPCSLFSAATVIL